MAAFVRAVAEGYRYLETDVHITADGQLVAFHDSRLDRVTDGRGVVQELPWSVLRRAKIGGRETIPLFTEVLELARDSPAVRLNIDPKTDATVGPLTDLIRASGLIDRICVGAFSDARLATITAVLGPDLATSLGPRAVARLAAGARLGRGFTSHAAAAQVPVRFGRIPVVTPRFLDTAHRAGLEVHVWTVNEPREMVRLLDLGVDGLMTDRPDLLRRVMIDRNEWN